MDSEELTIMDGGVDLTVSRLSGSTDKIADVIGVIGRVTVLVEEKNDRNFLTVNGHHEIVNTNLGSVVVEERVHVWFLLVAKGQPQGCHYRDKPRKIIEKINHRKYLLHYLSNGGLKSIR